MSSFSCLTLNFFVFEIEPFACRSSVLELCLESPLNSHVNVMLVQCYFFLRLFLLCFCGDVLI